MILTPTHCYGLSQALVLAVWPGLSHLMFGPLRKRRGIRVDALEAEMTNGFAGAGQAVETLHRDQLMALTDARHG